MNRLKLIVIHGIGTSFSEAIDTLLQVNDFTCVWHDSTYYVPERYGVVLRKLLNEPDPDKFITGFQKLIISRFMESSFEPNDVSEDERKKRVSFKESSLLRNFSEFGIPSTFHDRKQRHKQLKKEADKVLKNIFTLLPELKNAIDNEQGMLSEEQAREKIKEFSKKLSDDCDLTQLLEAIRDMHESGGDLDTVGSATFYTYWLLKQSEAQGQKLIYGKDFRYVFVNYHQGLRNLTVYGPADILMADFPTGAIPDLEGDVRYLAEHDIKIERFEDHHPYNNEQLATFEKLKDEGLIGFYALSGENQDEDFDEATFDHKCGADMVYENTIQNKSWDCDGAKELRKASHSEDFVTDRYELGLQLTALIKGGYCKIELAQLLCESITDNNAIELLKQKELMNLTKEWNDYFESVRDKLLNNAYFIHIATPENQDLALNGGKALGDGSDVPVSRKAIEDQKNAETLKIIMGLAVHSEPGEPKITTGKAVSFFKETFPDADYIFYCYGASILVARRLNQADFSLNLGLLMPKIGGEGDGGHAGAAVGRPEANESYPKEIIGNSVSDANFKNFVEYMKFKLKQSGIDVKKVEDHSTKAKKKQKGALALLITVAAALVIGLILVFFVSDFKRDNIVKSNKKFFPQVKVESIHEDEPAPEKEKTGDKKQDQNQKKGNK